MRYVVRKRNQKWLVCTESGLLEFEDLQEAFLVAWNAARVLTASLERGSGRKESDRSSTKIGKL
jgi:hypothetical protein